MSRSYTRKAKERPAPDATSTSEFPRAAAPAPPKIMKRTFVLDSSLGEVEVKLRGPAGAVRIESTHVSLVITTGETISAIVSASPKRAPAPARHMSGNPNEPSGTIEASLPGDDEAADRAAMELSAESLQFLQSTGKAMMRKVE